MTNVEEMKAGLAKEMVFKSLSAEAGFDQAREEDAFSAEFAEEVACYVQEQMYKRDRNKVTNSLLFDAYSVIEACKGSADPYKVKALLTMYWGYEIPARTA